jgi:hypothetical protein
VKWPEMAVFGKTVGTAKLLEIAKELQKKLLQKCCQIIRKIA